MAYPLDGESDIRETPAIKGWNHKGGIGVWGKSESGKAGSFEGDVEVTGNITAQDFLTNAQTGATGLVEQIADLVLQVQALRREFTEFKAGFEKNLAAVQDQLKSAIPHSVQVNLSDIRSLVGQARAELFVQTGSESVASVTLIGNDGFPEIKVVYGAPYSLDGVKGLRVSVILESPITDRARGFAVAIIQPGAQGFAVRQLP